MQIRTLDHYSIRTSDVEESVRFYRLALNMVTGPRPPFRFPGAWLYPVGVNGEAAGNALVHIVGVDPQDTEGLTDYLGAKESKEGGGTGKLDHVAFRVTGLAGTYAALKSHGIPFRERRVPEMDLHQVFLEDPNGITIELNYAAAEDLAASTQSA
ncbi:VOC family protein [Noviherbaspirillum sp.]|jgi:catechol 2,3-dioxygenase-like lactoylglutathione lyase family enzyme|uniref:VOC family protein n=1 Tax=Noviherbaspirillum sp. TaxID=1926288 RepID=UPI0025D271D9|nr:VOC family protein [Noviherbaspirillum sp.]